MKRLLFISWLRAYIGPATHCMYFGGLRRCLLRRRCCPGHGLVYFVHWPFLFIIAVDSGASTRPDFFIRSSAVIACAVNDEVNTANKSSTVAFLRSNNSRKLFPRIIPVSLAAGPLPEGPVVIMAAAAGRIARQLSHLSKVTG